MRAARVRVRPGRESVLLAIFKDIEAQLGSVAGFQSGTMLVGDVSQAVVLVCWDAAAAHEAAAAAAVRFVRERHSSDVETLTFETFRIVATEPGDPPVVGGSGRLARARIQPGRERALPEIFEGVMGRFRSVEGFCGGMLLVNEVNRAVIVSYWDPAAEHPAAGHAAETFVRESHAADVEMLAVETFKIAATAVAKRPPPAR